MRNQIRLTLTLSILLLTSTSCVRDLTKKYITDPLNKEVGSGVDSVFENTTTSPEQRAKANAISDKMTAASPKKLHASTTKRQNFKVGQWVVYKEHRTKGALDVRNMEMIVTSVNGPKVTLEITTWQARKESIPETWAVEFSDVKQPLDLVLSQDTVDKTADALKLHTFWSLRPDGSVIKEQHSGSGDKKDLNQLAGKLLLGEYLNRYFKDPETSIAPCQSPAVSSTSCVKHLGYRRNIIGERTIEDAFAHSEVPITGLVSASSENEKIELLAFGSSGRPSRLKGRSIKTNNAAPIPLDTKSDPLNKDKTQN